MAAKRADALIARLEVIESIQERIDLVAADFEAKKNRYASVDAWTLGELLDIDFETAGDDGRTYWGYRRELKDAGYDLPYADNVGRLKHLVSPKRFSELLQRAERLTEQAKPQQHDLRLSKREESLLEEAYAKDQSSGEGVSTAFVTVRSSTGVELDFEVVMDTDGPIEAYSPYDLRKGKGFDSSGYIELE